MAQTPEGKIKEKVKVLLNQYYVYWFMPVNTGLGAAGVDFHCVLPGGLAFFVETKKDEDEPLRTRQDNLLRKLHNMSIQTFVIYDDQSLRKLHMWLERNSMMSLQIKQVRIR